MEIIHSDVETARLSLGFHIPEYASEDTLALDLLPEVAGEGRSSRLYEKVKREQALVDSISAFAYTPRDPGLFVISALLSPDHLEKNHYLDSGRAFPPGPLSYFGRRA